MPLCVWDTDKAWRMKKGRNLILGEVALYVNHPSYISDSWLYLIFWMIMILSFDRMNQWQYQVWTKDKKEMAFYTVNAESKIFE